MSNAIELKGSRNVDGKKYTYTKLIMVDAISTITYADDPAKTPEVKIVLKEQGFLDFRFAQHSEAAQFYSDLVLGIANGSPVFYLSYAITG